MTFFNSASVLVEDNGVKILCDPWFVDGAYMGTWAIYPPYNFKPEDFDDVDYIYISHTHPDHFNIKTLEKMNKNIPVLILDYIEKFLKNNIERLGFKVTELNHNKRIALKNNLHINLVAADNCDPELCGQFLGCGLLEKRYGATWIDSMCVIDNNKEVLVNTNDCPFDLAKHPLAIVKATYKNIDMLLVGYLGAGPYPQCFDLSKNSMRIEGYKKQIRFLTMAESFISLLEPKYFMPFAGQHTMAGKNYKLNDVRQQPEMDEAFDYFKSSPDIDHTKSKGIILNRGSSFDITTGKASHPYEPIDSKSKEEYIQNVLSKVKFDYENDEFPSFEELSKLISESFKRFDAKRKEIGFNSETTILIKLPEDKYAAISFNGNDYKIVSKNDTKNYDKFVMFSIDARLLKLLLQGPARATWNGAELGSHIRFSRNPNIFERGLYYCMNYFFA